MITSKLPLDILCTRSSRLEILMGQFDLYCAIGFGSVALNFGVHFIFCLEAEFAGVTGL